MGSSDSRQPIEPSQINSSERTPQSWPPPPPSPLLSFSSLSFRLFLFRLVLILSPSLLQFLLLFHSHTLYLAVFCFHQIDSVTVVARTQQRAASKPASQSKSAGCKASTNQQTMKEGPIPPNRPDSRLPAFQVPCRRLRWPS